MGVAVTTFPDYLSCFNLASGGSKAGPSYLNDSNIVWGQDLIQLRQYLLENDIKQVKRDIFFDDGSIPYHLGAYGISSREIPSEERYSTGRGVYVLDVFSLHNMLQPDDKLMYQWLRDIEPTAIVGESIYVWDLR